MTDPTNPQHPSKRPIEPAGPAGSAGSAGTPAVAAVERCRAAGKGRLLLVVNLPESFAFCDAFYPHGHERHEIVSWDTSEFEKEPGLFEGVVKRAVEWGAQFIDVVGPAQP